MGATRPSQPDRVDLGSVTERHFGDSDAARAGPCGHQLRSIPGDDLKLQLDVDGARQLTSSDPAGRAVAP
ncbi:MAG: hypothetical protein QOI95_24 [Acidimicrobiaceae bacterium]|jgi:hypothetical protein